MLSKMKKFLLFGFISVVLIFAAFYIGHIPVKADFKPATIDIGNAKPEAASVNIPVNVPKTQQDNQKLSLKDIITARKLTEDEINIQIKVDKSDKLLTLYNGNTPVKSYHIELGDSGAGDKLISGDHKTPEGSFYISQKLVLNPADRYLGTRWMRLSYPNKEDAERGLKNGLISKATYNSIVKAISKGQTPPQNTALGGGVGVHGGSTAKLGTNWTYGCVGLTNKDVQDFYNYVKVGTKVTIQQ